jgi:hypothetical protein
LSNCYAQSVKNYQDSVADTKDLVVKWKVEYKTFKKIDCLLGVWLSDDDVDTVSGNQFEKCNNLQVDTSGMDISYGEIPPETPCETSDITVYPGTDEFAKTEYAAFSEYTLQVVQCLDMPNELKNFWDSHVSRKSSSSSPSLVAGSAAHESPGAIDLHSFWKRHLHKQSSIADPATMMEEVAINPEAPCGDGYLMQGHPTPMSTEGYHACSNWLPGAGNPPTTEYNVPASLMGAAHCKAMCDSDRNCTSYVKHGAFCEGSCDAVWETKCVLIRDCGEKKVIEDSGDYGTIHCLKDAETGKSASIGQESAIAIGIAAQV